MKTLEQIILENIEHLKKAKEKYMSEGHEAFANDIQININILSGRLHEYKNQNK